MEINNQEALKYNLSISQTITNICSPLFKNFEITYFAYIKIFHNGKMLRVSNHQEWSRIFFEKKFYNDENFYKSFIQDLSEHNDSKMLLWHTQPQQSLYQNLKVLQIANGISYFQKYNNYIESFSIGTSLENFILYRIFYDRKDIIFHFLNYFKEQAFNLLTPRDTRNLIHTNLSIE